jgi:hypothetical protein
MVANERKVLAVTLANYNITKLNNEILAKCLNKRKKYHTMEDDIHRIMLTKDSLKMDTIRSSKIDSLFAIKVVVFTQIANYNGSRIMLNDVMHDNTIQIVNKIIKKRIFSTKVEYDTITRNYSDINRKLFNNEYNRIILKNSTELNALIARNNALNLRIYHITNTYSIGMFQSNLIEYKTITEKIHNNLLHYTIVSIFLVLLFALIVYLLITDIAKKHESESRDRQMINMLIENRKK